MKLVDGAYITETELGTTLGDYYTKTVSDGKYSTKTALDTDVATLGYMKTFSADSKYLILANAVEYY